MNMDKIVIITTDGCYPCKVLKESNIIDAGGEQVTPEFLDIQVSSKAIEIVEKTGVMQAPSAFKEKDGTYSKCDLKFNKDNGDVVVLCNG